MKMFVEFMMDTAPLGAVERVIAALTKHGHKRFVKEVSSLIHNYDFQIPSYENYAVAFGRVFRYKEYGWGHKVENPLFTELKKAIETANKKDAEDGLRRLLK